MYEPEDNLLYNKQNVKFQLIFVWLQYGLWLG